jgi:hypothetical protein
LPKARPLIGIATSHSINAVRSSSKQAYVSQSSRKHSASKIGWCASEIPDHRKAGKPRLITLSRIRYRYHDPLVTTGISGEYQHRSRSTKTSCAAHPGAIVLRAGGGRSMPGGIFQSPADLLQILPCPFGRSTRGFQFNEQILKFFGIHDPKVFNGTLICQAMKPGVQNGRLYRTYYAAGHQGLAHGGPVAGCSK